MILAEPPITRIEADVPIDDPAPSHGCIVCKLCGAVIMEVIIAEVEDLTSKARMDRDMPALTFAHFGGVHGRDVGE
jgi:hypothetical protein